MAKSWMEFSFRNETQKVRDIHRSTFVSNVLENLHFCVRLRQNNLWRSGYKCWNLEHADGTVEHKMDCINFNVAALVFNLKGRMWFFCGFS